MTIAAAYLTSEGVVLGADSTTVVTASQDGGASVVAQLLNHAQKVFEVGEPGKGRLAVCTWGSGSVRGTSHRTLVARLADRADDSTTTVGGAADTLAEIVKEAFALENEGAPPPGFVGYYIGGWNPGSRDPGCLRLEFNEDGTERERHELAMGQASFSGSPEYFNRVFRGFDLRLPQLLYEELRARLDDLPPDFDDHLKEAFAAVGGKLVAAGYNDLPVREAIDYVHTYLHVSIKAAKFRFGLQPVGGPIEIGFISTDRRFRWVCHKAHSSAVFEQETGNHD